MNRIVFLGTGGGRHITVTQVRKTGGIYLELLRKRIILDPGPGSLVNACELKLNPQKWDGMLLSHFHVDHSTDANALLDAMHDEKTGRKPFLLTEKHCLKPEEACISAYHQNISDVQPMEAGKKTEINGIMITATRADHYSPNIGFVIDYGKRIGYVSDGTYYDGQEKNYEDCDVLIFNILVPKGREPTPKKHMSVDQAAGMLNKISKKPKLVVIQHFSFWMLRAMPVAQAKIIEKETGVRTLAASDYMELDLDNLKTRKLK